jgi:hypothetical protein
MIAKFWWQMMKEGTSLVERVEWKVLGKKGDSTFRETRDTNVDTIKGGKANPFVLLAPGTLVRRWVCI